MTIVVKLRIDQLGTQAPAIGITVVLSAGRHSSLAKLPRAATSASTCSLDPAWPPPAGNTKGPTRRGRLPVRSRAAAGTGGSSSRGGRRCDDRAVSRPEIGPVLSIARARRARGWAGDEPDRVVVQADSSPTNHPSQTQPPTRPQAHTFLARCRKRSSPIRSPYASVPDLGPARVGDVNNLDLLSSFGQPD